MALVPASARGQDAACADRVAPIPPPPSSVAESPDDPFEYTARHAMGADFDLGVGAVHAVDDLAADWLRRVQAPVWAEPGGALLGWVANGWWVAADRPDDPVPLVADVMVETGYETPSWIVEEARDGAVRIRFADALPGGGDGTGWALLCHLAASTTPLEYVPWEATVGTEEGLGTLLFYRTDAAHTLRAGPGEAHEAIDALRSEEEPMLEPLEVRGDWMRVRVTRPSTYCAFPEPTDGRVDEGWIRWRDDAMGPWVWYYTRGC